MAGVATAALVGPMTAAERAKGRYMRAPDGHGGGLGDLLDDEAPAASSGSGESGSGGDDSDAGAGEAASSGSGESGSGGDDGGEADWWANVSAESGDGEEASNRDWLKGTKVKDLDSLVKIARDNQRALRESGRIKVPGDNAKPEEIKAFRDALGVPEDPAGYKVDLPEEAGGNYELDKSFVEPLAKIAHEQNIPAKAFNELARAVMQGQLEEQVATARANDEQRDAIVKSWGADAPAKKAEFRRGAEVLGLDKAAINKIQAGYGVAETLDLLVKIGGMAGEDFFSSGNGSQKFGAADLESAERQLEAVNSEPGARDRLKKGSPSFDPTFAAKRDRLIAAVAHFREQASKRP